MAKESINKMVQISLAKKDLLIQILKLTNIQKELIAIDDIDRLDSILGEKEILMGKIDESDSEFLSLYNSIKEQEKIESMDDIDSKKYLNIRYLQDIIREINTILVDITDIDQVNTSNMKNNLDMIKSELKQIKEVKKAYKGYNYEVVESMLIDEKK